MYTRVVNNIIIAADLKKLKKNTTKNSKAIYKQKLGNCSINV